MPLGESHSNEFWPPPANHDFGCLNIWRADVSAECRHGTVAPSMRSSVRQPYMSLTAARCSDCPSIYERRMYDRIDRIIGGTSEFWTEWVAVDDVPASVMSALYEADVVVSTDDGFVQREYRRGKDWSVAGSHGVVT